MKARKILLSWDFLLAIPAGLAPALLLPEFVSDALARDVYQTGISVLSIVFAVFFTALAIIIASGDDDFIVFLKDVGVYEGIVVTYKFTLWLLFLALMFSVLGFLCTAAAKELGYCEQSKYFLAIFAFLFFYSLFAVIAATRDAIEWANNRIRFVEIRDKAKTSTVRQPPPP